MNMYFKESAYDVAIKRNGKVRGITKLEQRISEHVAAKRKFDVKLVNDDPSEPAFHTLHSKLDYVNHAHPGRPVYSLWLTTSYAPNIDKQTVTTELATYSLELGWNFMVHGDWLRAVVDDNPLLGKLAIVAVANDLIRKLQNRETNLDLTPNQYEKAPDRHVTSRSHLTQ